MESTLEDLGFSPAFQVEPDPEEPWDGGWACPVYGWDRHGRLAPDFVMGLRSSVVRVIPDRGSEWIGMFVGGADGGLSGFYGCPSQDYLCVAAEGLAYVLDVTAPSEGAAVCGYEVRQIVGVPQTGVILLVSPTDILAIAKHGGVAWRSDPFALANFSVEEVRGDVITCRGDGIDGESHVQISGHTGRTLHLN
jgi:hypothetical protein